MGSLTKTTIKEVSRWMLVHLLCEDGLTVVTTEEEQGGVMAKLP